MSVDTMQWANQLWSQVQNIKTRYDKYTPIINSLTKERDSLRQKLLTADENQKQVLSWKLTDIDTRVNNLEAAKGQMLTLLERARAANEQWLIANKQNNAIAWARDKWAAVAWVSRAWWSVWEKLAAWMWIDAEIQRRDLAAEEAANKVKANIYQTGSTIPYNIETLAQNKVAQDRSGKIQADQMAMSEAQMTDAQRAKYDARKNLSYNRYF